MTPFVKDKKVEGTRPNTLISDRTLKFYAAFNEELWTNKYQTIIHINYIRFQGDHNNNKMEHMNEVRWRENDELTKESGYPYTQGFTDIS